MATGTKIVNIHTFQTGIVVSPFTSNHNFVTVRWDDDKSNLPHIVPQDMLVRLFTTTNR